jgi:hypothetical protein
MKWKIADHQTGLNIVSAIILLVGLSSAFLIYRTAENIPTNILGYEQGDEAVYPVMPDDSKKYLRDLELYGGKANVLMDQYRRWFVGLWRGKSLAFSITVITVCISLVIFYIANHFPSSFDSNSRDENDGGKTE